MGSSDKPSQDAEQDSGDEYEGTDGGGEELESSQRPGEDLSVKVMGPVCRACACRGHSLSLVDTGRIRLVLELRFLMAMVSYEMERVLRRSGAVFESGGCHGAW